jgi:hypothetical protein
LLIFRHSLRLALPSDVMDIVLVLRTSSDDSPNASTEIPRFQKVKQAPVTCAVVEYSYSAKLAEVVHPVSRRKGRALKTKLNSMV